MQEEVKYFHLQNSCCARRGFALPWFAAAFLLLASAARTADLEDLKRHGTLRHLGIPYANFVTGTGDGLDVELMQLFAESLGLHYEYVPTDWGTILGDLTGAAVKANGSKAQITGKTPIKGDVAASGITVLPWRQDAVAFSRPVFPTQVWLIARADSTLAPIAGCDSLEQDILAVKALLQGRSLYCKANTCLDPGLYDLPATGAAFRLFPGSLNELAPAVIQGEAELTLLDVPDTLVALQKWPRDIKVIGPVSPVQDMAVAFRKDSPRLRAAFNQFLSRIQRDGTHQRLVKKYYPFVFESFPAFFPPAPIEGTAKVAADNPPAN